MKKSLIIIVFLLLSLLASLFLVFRTTIFMGRAAAPSSATVALDNSYLFASPLTAKADNKSKIRITVFLLDGRGLGVANQVVDLKIDSSLTITPVQAISDDSGKTVFDLNSSVKGQYQISALVNNKTIPQKIKVVFY